MAVQDKPLSKTRLMHTAYLSSEQTRGYISELLAKGLLSYDKESNSFLTTELGKKYLKLYDGMKRLGTE